ncbi:VOC family protein [bacterium]|nr:VOC family protein [bacterium]
MFKVTATQHVLAVNNLEEAESYFIDKLGFELCFRVDGWSFISLQDFHVMLGHCPDELPARDTNNHSYFVYVNCEGIDSIYNTYQERGVDFTQTISDKPWGMREFAIITPEGHRMMFGQEIQE